MPSRWWVPVRGVDPQRIELQHIHGAVSGWFDWSEEDHARQVKPYAVSPLTQDERGRRGVEVSTLTDVALARLHVSAGDGTGIRLGSQVGRLGHPELIVEETWSQLGTPSGASSWRLDFVTPVSFRSGRRWSPWAAPSSILHGLSQSWSRWSGSVRQLSHQQVDTIWVSRVDGASRTLRLGRLEVVGFLGVVGYRCDDPAVAELADGLFRLAAYAGVGSAKGKGLGVTRVTPKRQRSGRAPSETRRAG